MSYDNLFWGGLNRAGVNVPNHTQWKIKAESLLSVCNIWTPTADKRFPLGALTESRDGRRWRYNENGGTNLSTTLMNQAAAGTAGWLDEIQTNSPGVPTAGDKIVTVTLTTTAVAGDFIDGYLVVTDATGEANMYLIKDNKTGVANSVTGFDVVIEIADKGGIRTAWGTSSYLSVRKNKNKDVIVTPASPTGTLVGVNLVAVTADYFFWAQTRGACPILVDSDGLVVGDAVQVSLNSGGSASILDGGVTDVEIGRCIDPGVSDADTGIIDLTIE